MADSGWKINGKKIRARDETLRDGNQGEAPRSAYRAVKHLLDTCDYFDHQSIGWIYTNPCDEAAAEYLREHGEAIKQKKPNFDTNKFFIYSLLYRGDEKLETLAAPENTTPMGVMLRDLQSKKQPYGAINILTKARCDDLTYLGLDSKDMQKSLEKTIKLYKEANPEIRIEIALEHFYTAWLEEKNQKENRKHIIDTLVTGILNGVEVVTAPDTDGAHKPDEIKKVIEEVTAAIKNDSRLQEQHKALVPAIFTAHMHDDLGNAVANTCAALEAGAGWFDCTAGIIGERRGNVTLANMAERLGHPEEVAIKTYQSDLMNNLGIREGDKQKGSAEAFCAVGGMHADMLFKKLQESGKTYDEFVSSYDGSYASVPAHESGQTIQATLSPVAGRSNVLFMLSGLGLDIDDKDTRVNEVLKRVKDDEFKKGMNYRGYNNANAFLLLADSFDLRKKPEISIPNPPETIQGKIDDTELTTQADRWLNEIKRDGQAYADLSITEARKTEAFAGAVRAKDGDPLHPVAEEECKALQLIFSIGDTPENVKFFQANGVGKDYAEAMEMAMKTMLEFRLFQIEQERNKNRVASPSAGIAI